MTILNPKSTQLEGRTVRVLIIDTDDWPTVFWLPSLENTGVRIDYQWEQCTQGARLHLFDEMQPPYHLVILPAQSCAVVERSSSIAHTLALIDDLQPLRDGWYSGRVHAIGELNRNFASVFVTRDIPTTSRRLLSDKIDGLTRAALHLSGTMQ